MSIIVYGPAGCGKTSNAERLRKHFGLKAIVDNARNPYRHFLEGGSDILYLTQSPPEHLERTWPGIIAFADAMKLLDSTKEISQ